MSTEKKESTTVKGQAKRSTAPRSPIDNAGQKGKAPDGQRKPEAKATGNIERTAANERANDNKRPRIKKN